MSATPNVGFGSTDIILLRSTPLAGLGRARTACHAGIHDRIAANCIFFHCEGEFLAVFSCEVIGLRAELCDRIRERLPGALSLAPERLVVTATHTHGAPVLQGDYLDHFLDRAAGAVVAAQADLRPAAVGSGIARHCEWMGFNRRRLETSFLPVDREAPFLTIREEDGGLRGLVFNYAHRIKAL